MSKYSEKISSKKKTTHTHTNENRFYSNKTKQLKEHLTFGRYSELGYDTAVISWKVTCINFMASCFFCPCISILVLCIFVQDDIKENTWRGFRGKMSGFDGVFCLV